MNTQSHSIALAFAAGALLFATTATAATSEAQQRYQSERAACMNGTSNQDRATCLKEAGAALQEAQRGHTSTASGADLQRNRLARCEALPPRDHDECVLRMSGAGQASGTERDGGILREVTTPAKSN